VQTGGNSQDPCPFSTAIASFGMPKLALRDAVDAVDARRAPSTHHPCLTFQSPMLPGCAPDRSLACDHLFSLLPFTPHPAFFCPSPLTSHHNPSIEGGSSVGGVCLCAECECPCVLVCVCKEV